MKAIFSLAIAIVCFSCAEQKLPVVQMETCAGSIEIEIDTINAPISSANFFRYVDENRWEGAHFYRILTMQNQPDNDVKVEVIQGGLGNNDELRLPMIPHEPTSETGILHKDGVISMARMDPGTEDSEFFICIGEQPALDFGGKRNPDGQGFSAFGKVVSGMDVVLAIQALAENPETPQYLMEECQITSIKRK